MFNLNNELQEKMGIQGYDSKPITGKVWDNGEGYQLYKVEEDLEYDGETYRITAIQKCTFDRETPDDIDTAEFVFFEAHKI